MRAILLIILFLLQGMGARGDSLKNHWNQTDLSLSYIQKNFFNNQLCHQNLNHFMGCIEGLNSILSQLPEPQQIKISPSLPNKFQKVKYQSKPSNVSLQDWVKKIKIEQQENYNFWRQQFIKKVTINFEYELSSTLADLDPKYLKYHLSLIINSVLKNIYDPHTFLTPTSFLKTTSAQESMEIIGVGIYTRSFYDKMVITNLQPHTSAFESGLSTGDIITSINGIPVHDKPYEEALKLLSGPEESVVELTVLRQESHLNFQLKRQKYFLDNIKSRVIDSPQINQKLGYLSISSFKQTGICTAFINEYKKLLSHGVSGLIIDLRFNPGGWISEVNCITSAFLPPGINIITLKDQKSGTTKEVYKSLQSEIKISLPTVVLVNSFSASSSEVMAGALQDLLRAYIVGDKTFGKGTIQRYTTFELDNVTIAKTVGLIHLPSGRSNQIAGIIPDFHVYSGPRPLPIELESLREADLYRNPIVPKNPRSINKRSKFFSIQQCVKDHGTASKDLSKNKTFGGFDYQLLTARDVLNCHIQMGSGQLF